MLSVEKIIKFTTGGIIMRDFNKKLRVVLIDDNANHLRGIKELNQP